MVAILDDIRILVAQPVTIPGVKWRCKAAPKPTSVRTEIQLWEIALPMGLLVLLLLSLRILVILYHQTPLELIAPPCTRFSSTVYGIVSGPQILE